MPIPQQKHNSSRIFETDPVSQDDEVKRHNLEANPFSAVIEQIVSFRWGVLVFPGKAWTTF
jgi:hypothetical protein